MIGRVYAIAINAFRESIRKKVLYVVLGAVIAFNLFALVIGAMSLHEEARVARDFGLFGVSFFGSITAIVLGGTLLYTEIERRTIHVILSKPIERHEFVLGKYLGLAFTSTVLVAAFAVAMAGLLRLVDMPFDGNVAEAVLLGWLEVLIVAAIAVFFSSFATPFMAGLFTFALFVIGRASDELRWAAARSKIEAVKILARGALWIVPDLHMYSISGSQLDGKWVSVHGTFVPWSYVGTAALYALAVVAVLLGMAIVIFHRRDFT